MRKTNNNYYPQGYLGKIAYHMFKGNFDKVQYFENVRFRLTEIFQRRMIE